MMSFFVEYGWREGWRITITTMKKTTTKKKPLEYSYELITWLRRTNPERKSKKVAPMLQMQIERKELGLVCFEVSPWGCPLSSHQCFLWRWLYLFSPCCFLPAVDLGHFRFQDYVFPCWMFYLSVKLACLAQHVEKQTLILCLLSLQNSVPFWFLFC